MSAEANGKNEILHKRVSQEKEDVAKINQITGEKLAKPRSYNYSYQENAEPIVYMRIVTECIYQFCSTEACWWCR